MLLRIILLPCLRESDCGLQVPWEPRATSPKVSWSDAWFLSVFDRFARAALKQGQLRLILPTGEERCYGAFHCRVSAELIPHCWLACQCTGLAELQPKLRSSRASCASSCPLARSLLWCAAEWMVDASAC